MPDRFVTNACGSITDTYTGKEWFVGPDWDKNWQAAKTLVESNHPCNADWRLPTYNEVKNLNRAPVAELQKVAFNRVLNDGIWSSHEQPQDMADCITLGDGEDPYAEPKTKTENMRAVGVKIT